MDKRAECFPCAESERITRIETTVEDIHHRLFGNGQPGELASMSKRIGTLEQWFWRIMGGGAVVLFLLQWVRK